MNTQSIIREVQSSLGIAADGIAGPKTWEAILSRISPRPAQIPPVPIAASDKVDARSESHIATLHPRAQPYARALVHAAAAQGIAIKVISGTRSYAEQDALYEQGRGRTGPIVTNARGGFSNHNFGIAFDIGIFDGAGYRPESPLYKVVGSLGKGIGLEWGGDWTTIRDEPHFEIRPAWARDVGSRDMLAGLRERRSRGADTFA